MLSGLDADDAANAHVEEGVRIKPVTVGEQDYCGFMKRNTDQVLELEVDDEGTRVTLTIVDTPGFGDQIDNESRFECHISS